MHLVDRSVGFEGSVPIVAGTIPIAVGAALKSKMKKDKTISIAFLVTVHVKKEHFTKA